MRVRFQTQRAGSRHRGGTQPPPMTLMPMETYRNASGLVMRIDLLGAAPESVDLTLEDHHLMVCAEPAPATGEPGALLHKEVSLAGNLDGRHARACCDDGILIITVPFAA